ncbi:MAG: YdbL family protein [Sphingomonas sp.]|uniref:YdbL family protein n=1 Tax=unclassified Sphingomonas TaxID=196159 RepID=UPI002453BB6E|nr:MULTISPECIES: YdbL family protein [unclassified Sphingomonas]MBQ1499760.1 YdbL family protein [Sphingomonas sp.]MDH4746286.1 YdbL family protein [Sphingomonas sp. CBMAI 2297]
MRNLLSTFGLAAALAAAMVAPASAQRDPAYQAARQAGLVGEQPDGYLGIVGSPTAELQAMVNNINIQRKRQYTQQAAASSTVEQMAFVTGCNLIARTAPGEKYQAPDGRWLTRGGDAPVRDPRCL